jgi:hypothetical protein
LEQAKDVGYRLALKSTQSDNSLFDWGYTDISTAGEETEPNLLICYLRETWQARISPAKAGKQTARKAEWGAGKG